jgi:hypothetical protein
MSGNIPPSRRMPSHPSSEQLRKQAKDLLERYRAQDPAAIAEVERFERELDPASFALHDAQRVLARAYGYESWPRLKAFVDGVNVRELADSVAADDMNKVRMLLTARPELVGTDLADSASCTRTNSGDPLGRKTAIPSMCPKRFENDRRNRKRCSRTCRQCATSVPLSCAESWNVASVLVPIAGLALTQMQELCASRKRISRSVSSFQV